MVSLEIGCNFPFPQPQERSIFSEEKFVANFIPERGTRAGRSQTEFVDYVIYTWLMLIFVTERASDV